MKISTQAWKSVCGALLVAAMVLPGISKAVTYTDLASWEAAVGSTAGVDLSMYADYTAVTAVDLAGQATMTLSHSVEKRTVPSTWLTWSGGRTPGVLFSTTDFVTATFSTDITAFGMFMEPNIQSIFTMSLLLSDGSTVTQSVAGSSGAAFFGWSGQSISSITMTCGTADAGCLGFAFGEMMIASASVPEAASLALLSIGLLSLGAGAMRRRNKRA